VFWKDLAPLLLLTENLASQGRAKCSGQGLKEPAQQLDVPGMNVDLNHDSQFESRIAFETPQEMGEALAASA